LHEAVCAKPRGGIVKGCNGAGRGPFSIFTLRDTQKWPIGGLGGETRYLRNPRGGGNVPLKGCVGFGVLEGGGKGESLRGDTGGLGVKDL